MGRFVFRESELPTEQAPHPDLTKPFRASYIPCPKCNVALRKVAANAGSYFVTCDNRVPSTAAARGAERRSDRCGQTVHVVAIEGVAFVTPVAKEQFARWMRTYPKAAEVYSELGIILQRSDDIVALEPVFPCDDCHEPRPIRELYAGLCRRCSPQLERQA